MLSPADIGESTRDSALPWDRIRPAEFERQPGVEGELPLLAKLHDSRIDRDADFQALQGDIQSLDRIRSQTSVSLNLATRKAEREALDQERLERENERRKALGMEPLARAEDLEAAEEPDAILAEAAEIAADAYLGTTPAGGALLSQYLASRENSR
jgi:carboxyl-terminal processing protease